MSSPNYTLSCNCNSNSKTDIPTVDLGLEHLNLDRFVDVGNELADASGDVIRKYFRKSFDILDKEDLSQLFFIVNFEVHGFICLFFFKNV